MTRSRWLTPPLLCAALASVQLSATLARADEPIARRQTWTGNVTFFATGAPLAVDGPDMGEEVDAVAQPASVTITSGDIPEGSLLEAGFLYWGGSIAEDGCGGATVDDEVTFTPPGGQPTAVIAEECYCSTAGAMSYDIQVCRAEISDLIGELNGDYTVSDFDVLIENMETNNASFSVVLVHGNEFLPPRRVALYDGLQTMSMDTTAELTLALDELDVDDPAEGDLTWYVLEGDVNGSMFEQVSVMGSPGNQSAVLEGPLNPPDNPMNHSINTTTPPQADAIGVDIDRFAVDDALTPGDAAVEVTYSAGFDKWWIAYNIVGINVYQAVFLSKSTKEWALQDDVDGDGAPSPGDTVRYTIRVENSGTASAPLVVQDSRPAEAASWAVIADGGVTPSEMGDTFVFDAYDLAPGEAAQIVIDVVVGDVPDLTEMVNVASYDAGSDGDAGEIAAPPVVIRVDGDGDTVYDSDDNCPNAPNDDQADADDDGIGDACDDDATTGDPTDATTDPSTTAGSSSGDAGSDTGAGSETDPTTTTASGGGDSDSASNTFGDTDTAGEDSDGCGCASGGEGAPALALLLALAGLVRRRR